MKAFHMALLAVISVLLIGLVLIAVPNSGPRFVEVWRDGVEPMAGVGTVTNIDLRSGYYEVWAVDADSDERDYESLGFDMGDGGGFVTIARDSTPISRDTNGMRYEIVCSFALSRRDTYFYTVWANGTELDGEHFDLIFMHEANIDDRPIQLAGLSMVIAGLACSPLVLLFRREPRKKPDV